MDRPGKTGKVFFGTLLLLALSLFPVSEAAWGLQTQFRKNPAISGIIPEKPMKMQLKRDAQGRYSWTIEGTNVYRMIREDEKFRAYVDRLKKRGKSR
ncbi:MAG: hypothetical protein M0Z75_10985 [Nitrospiraceae bacterium]|nr:hypothetical protein [Nitrospiraceae bacterium]